MFVLAIVSALQSAFNTWLKLEAKTHGQALMRLQQLQGKLLALHLSELNNTVFYIMPTAEQVYISTAYDAPADVDIYASMLALLRLSRAQDSGKTILEQGVRLEGDLALGQTFSHILAEAQIDWEELLSRILGDSTAYQFGELGRNTQAWLDDTGQAMRHNTQEYLQEEAKLLPSHTELTQYLDAVDTLRMDADRLAARVERLLKTS